MCNDIVYCCDAIATVLGSTSVSPEPYVIENTVDLENDHTDVYLALGPSVVEYKR